MWCYSTPKYKNGDYNLEQHVVGLYAFPGLFVFAAWMVNFGILYVFNKYHSQS